MNRKYNVFLVSDSTGETLDRIFLALKAQFENFNNSLHHFSFVRTETQITTLLEKCNKLGNSIVLYTLVEPGVTAFLIRETDKPLDSNNAPIDAAAIPFPSDETTPPVMKMYLVFAII